MGSIRDDLYLTQGSPKALKRDTNLDSPSAALDVMLVLLLFDRRGCVTTPSIASSLAPRYITDQTAKR